MSHSKYYIYDAKVVILPILKVRRLLSQQGCHLECVGKTQFQLISTTAGLNGRGGDGSSGSSERSPVFSIHIVSSCQLHLHSSPFMLSQRLWCSPEPRAHQCTSAEAEPTSCVPTRAPRVPLMEPRGPTPGPELITAPFPILPFVFIIACSFHKY